MDWAKRETDNPHQANTKLQTDFEKKLATYLLPLPIDQRYGIKDMKTIVETIYEYIK